ncbi:MAG: hypothetical protein AB1894_23095 [Chloroflexota bacterium]
MKRQTAWIFCFLILMIGCRARVELPTPIPTTSLPVQTLSPTVTPTQAISRTPSLWPTLPAPTHTAALPGFEVTSLREGQPSDEERCIVTAFWSQDGAKIYYAMDSYAFDASGSILPRSPEWFVIDLHSQTETKMTSSPSIVYPPILNLQFTYPQYEGFISPSGRYRLAIEPKNILWLIDTAGEQRPIKVIESGSGILRREPYWLPGEHRVVFSVTIGEIGIELYLLDLDTETVTSLTDAMVPSKAILLEWALSPDGEKIALIDYQGFRILSLEGETLARLSGYFWSMRWSQNSQLVYFFSWSGTICG